MSDYKCVASHEGICQNVYGYGTKCNGYSKACKLRPHYENISKVARNAKNTIKKSFGIVGDRE